MKVTNIVNWHYTFDCNRGAALLVEAADMGDPDAQYELGCRLRVEVSFCRMVFCFVFVNQSVFFFILGKQL